MGRPRPSAHSLRLCSFDFLWDSSQREEELPLTHLPVVGPFSSDWAASSSLNTRGGAWPYQSLISRGGLPFSEKEMEKEWVRVWGEVKKKDQGWGYNSVVKRLTGMRF